MLAVAGLCYSAADRKPDAGKPGAGDGSGARRFGVVVMLLPERARVMAMPLAMAVTYRRSRRITVTRAGVIVFSSAAAGRGGGFSPPHRATTGGDGQVPRSTCPLMVMLRAKW